MAARANSRGKDWAAPRRGLSRAAVWLREPRRDQLPKDPVQRFKVRQELVRRAQHIAWSQLYGMRNELGALIQAYPPYRTLLVKLLSHYAGDSLVTMMQHEIVAVVRQLAPEGGGSPPGPAARSRDLSGEAWLRRQLEELGEVGPDVPPGDRERG